MIFSLSTAKAALDFFPGEMDYRRATVNVMGGKSGIAQCSKQRAHFTLRQLFSRLDSGFARNRAREPFVPGGSARDAIPGQRVESLSQTTLGVEAWMRHRHGVDDQRVSTKTLDLEPETLEIVAICVKCLALGRPEMQRQWEKQSLRRRRAALERTHELFIQHALVRRVLVDQDQSIFVLETDVRPPQLE